MSFFRPSRRAAVAVRTTGLAVTVSALAVLAACAPDLGPMAKVKPATDYAVAKTLSAPTASAWPDMDWWKAYNDPQLTSLIEEALKGAPDLKVAQARVRQAQGRAQQAGAALLPDVGAKGSIQATAISLNVPGIPSSAKDFLPDDWQPFTQLGANISYQLDFFGRNRAALSSAASQQRAMEYELAAARLTLSTGVASAYADLVRLTADRQAALEAVRVRGDSLTLVSNRLQNGLENQSQVAQSSAEQNVSLGDVAALDAQIDNKRHELAALVGAGPDHGLDITPNLDSIAQPWGLPSVLAADLIGRRPDVAAARLRAEAASARIKVAQADFYPNISLTGSVLDLSLTPDQIFTKNVVLAQVGPAISLPIFKGGQLQGAYRGARGEYDEAVANYDKAVAQALREVADAISMQRGLTVQLQYADKAAGDSEKAYNLATLRYKGGLSPYLVVLTAESTLVSQKRAQADLRAQTLSANVALVRALGGGFIEQNLTKNANLKGPSNG